MKTIKRGRHAGNSDLPDTVGGASGEDSVAEMFKEAYEKLYNSAPSEEDMTSLKESLENMIGAAAKKELSELTGNVVKEAVGKLKLSKTDVSGSYVSDALKYAPDLLYNQLALIFRSWVTHGTVTPSLLACSFMPLLKSAMKDPSDCSSYRAIAGSSLILKVFELVIISLWGHVLSSDTLQFGYKAEYSTSQCSWFVMEVAAYFVRRGSPCIVTLLDCTKAFDKCRFDLIFQKLLCLVKIGLSLDKVLILAADNS